MRYLESPCHDPRWNLALEQYLFDHADRSHGYLMLWQNENTIVVGKYQNTVAEINNAYVREKNITVVRRLSGGGAVYHDLGNLNFTFIVDASDVERINFRMFCEPVMRALATFGVTAELSGRNDITVDGKKISGNAQCVRNGVTMHHGTLLFDASTAEMGAVLKKDTEKLAHKGVRSHASRVVNLREMLGEGVSIEDFISHIEREVLTETGAKQVSLPDDAAIEPLRARNASEEWIFSERRYLTEYGFTRRQKYPFGIVSVSLRLAREVIEEAVISGDFFGQKPIEELEALLVGRRVDEPLGIDPSPYIAGMTEEELASLLRP